MRANSLRLKAYVCGVLAAASAMSGSVFAAEEEKATLLEEIVVTAERREQNLQEVPLSITAFSDSQREKIGIVSIQDMANFSPGVSYSMSTDRPSIRGVARQSNFFSLDSPVANYFDGVYTSSVQDAQRRPIFIERTEILRGPQGSLAGRGSIGGSINTISKGPKDVASGEFRMYGGNYSSYGLEGTITGPVTEWFRARLNLGKYRQEDGYFNNVATGGSEGDQPNNRSIADIIMDFDLGKDVDLYVNLSFVDYNESRRTGYSTAPFTSGVIGAPSAYGPSTSTLTPLAWWGYFSPGSTFAGTHRENPVITTGDTRNFVSDQKSNQQLDDHHAYKMHLTWHAPFGDIKWIGGHQNYKYTQLTEVPGIDGTDVLTMRLPATAAFPAGRVVSPGGTNMYMEEREWFSNELTFTSTNDGPLNYIVGVYQSNEVYNQEPATTTFPGYPELNTPGTYVPPTFAFVLGIPNPRPFTSQIGILDGETISSAGFGQVEYVLSDAWKFALGARYNRDEKEVTESLRYIANGLGPNGGSFAGVGRATDVTPVPVANAPLPAGVIRDRGIDPISGYRIRDMKNEWEAVTGSVGVDFTPIENNMIYARYSKGYRPGGFNAGFLYDPPMVDEETVSSFEVGYKATLWGRLSLSTSVFYYDYQDVQLPLPTLGRCTTPGDPSSCTTLNSFINLATATSQGVEVEANWQVTEDLNLYFSYGYLDAAIDDALTGNPAGFSNPEDPAAILQNANPLATLGPVGNCTRDTGYTNLCRRTQDLSGNKFANSPEHKAAFNANYTFRLSGGNLLLSASYAWRAEQYSDVFEMEEGIVPSFGVAGARIIWTDTDDRYTFMLYGSNLADTDAADSASTTRLRTTLGGPTTGPGNAAGAAYFHNENLLPPREFGLEVQYRFGG